MAFDAFLKIDGIDGEATESKHVKWIQIDSFSWSAQNNVDRTGAGMNTGTVSAEGFSFKKMVDQSSPKLAQSCCTGAHIGNALLEVCQSSGERTMYLQYKLEDVIISGFSVGASQDSVKHSAVGLPGTSPGAGSQNAGLAGRLSDRPEETVTISFSKYTMTYKPTNSKGAPTGSVAAGYDLKQNVKA